jgi:glycerophosphoryl diester phosphodiesterase
MTRLPTDFFHRPFAHRGLHDRAAGIIENSLPAIRAAAQAGYAIEIDVQPSRDATAMVFHDDMLDRLTAETGPIWDRDADALARIALTGGRGALIASLADVLGAIAGRVPLVVEIKRQRAGPGALETSITEMLGAYHGPVAVMSFDPRVVAWFQRNAPHIARGLVSYAHDDPEDVAGLSAEERRGLADLASFDALGADFVSYDAADLPRPAVRALRARGVPILCWTIRSDAAAIAAREHVDAITFEGFHPALG